MTESTNGSLSSALAEFQANLPRIGKGNTADTGKYTYSYADLAEVSAAVLPALGRHGLSWTTLPMVQDDGKFVLSYQLRHVSGESLAGMYPLPAANSAPQVLGSALTYARRYCLCAVTGVSPDDDDDGAAAQAAGNGSTASEADRTVVDWEGQVGAFVKAADRAGLAKLWKEAKQLRPDDTELRSRIGAAAKQIQPAQTAVEDDPGVGGEEYPPGVSLEYLAGKSRRELDKHLFALLAEGGVSDSESGRETRLLILSRLCNKTPVITSSGVLSDGEVAGVIVTLDRYRLEERLHSELAELSRPVGAS